LNKEISVGIYWKTKSAKGDATEKNHTEWIKLDGLSLGSSRAVVSQTGRVADRAANTGVVGEIHLTKDMDSASMDLFMASCVGDGEDMEIDVTRAGSKQDKSEITYLKYTLKNALVTSYAFNSTGANPSETLTINFSKITMSYTPQDAAAKGGGAIPVTFDQETGTGEGA
jgi:type VI secretion system secreted protein Hcp